MSVLTLCLLWLTAGSVLAAEDSPLHKVGAAAMKAAQYATDGTVAGKLTELTDGNTTTRWMCRPDAKPEAVVPIRLVFDMGNARTVGKLRIANYFTGNNFDRGFKVVDVYVSDTIAPATGGQPTVADQQIAISTANGPAWTDITLAKQVKARYVTVRVKSNWGGSVYAANEVEIYTVEADPSLITQYNTADAVIGTPYELVDQNPATRWMCRDNGTPQSVIPIRLMIDLGKEETVSQVRIANYSAPTHGNLDRGIKTVDLFVANTLAPATGGTPTVADAQVAISNGNGTVWTTIELPKPMQTRYLTLRIKDNWGGKLFAFNEVEVVTKPVETPQAH